MINCIKKILIHEAIDSISQSISEPVNSNKRTYLLEKGLNKLGWRALRRLVAFRFSGQKKHLQNTAQTHWKKCLWLYYDVPQIGDALMDLAPRSLLKSLGISIDLYTHSHIAALFTNDSWLNLVETNPFNINIKNYDFVITSSFKWRSLKHKFFYANHLPWISIFGKFSGPELNRSLYSTKRIAEIFKANLSLSEMEFHARQKLEIKQTDIEANKFPNSVILTLGGVDASRTYRDWYNVALGLRDLGINNIILVGSDNGITYTDKIRSLQSGSFSVHDYVGKTSLQECKKLMQSASIIIAADGGLMHLAATCSRPMIGLFNQAINPSWRLPKILLELSISSETRDLNDIPSKTIIDAVHKHIS